MAQVKVIDVGFRTEKEPENQIYIMFFILYEESLGA